MIGSFFTAPGLLEGPELWRKRLGSGLTLRLSASSRSCCQPSMTISQSVTDLRLGFDPLASPLAETRAALV